MGYRSLIALCAMVLLSRGATADYWATVLKAQPNSETSPIGSLTFEPDDILDHDYAIMKDSMVIMGGRSSPLPPNAAFYAALNKYRKQPFIGVSIWDGLTSTMQKVSEPTSLYDMLHSNGTRPLFDWETGLNNTGVMTILGNKHAQPGSQFPCFYPRKDATACEKWYDGDSTDKATAFVLADLSVCRPEWQNTPNAWGSRDCYEVDQGGGVAGFFWHRPVDGAGVAWVTQSYQNRGFEVAFLFATRMV